MDELLKKGNIGIHTAKSNDYKLHNSPHLWKEIGRIEEYIRSRYKKAVEINPGCYEAYCNLGYAHHQHKNFEEALGQRQLTDYRLLDMRYKKQLVAREWS